MYFVENQQRHTLNADVKIQNVANVRLSLKQCNKNEKLSSEAARFFSSVVVVSTSFSNS